MKPEGLVVTFPAFDEASPEEARYAIYFFPEPESDLARFGGRWLGRDCAKGESLEQPEVPGISSERLAEVTASARNYGFHATLKPPFRLKAGRSLSELNDALDAFVRERFSFEVQLKLKSLGGFLALMMSPPDYRMSELAADCVREFDPFRALADEAELARRRQAGLSAQQEALLQQWGYPYVMGEFRFHMTLSSRLPEGAEREAISERLAELSAPVCAQPTRIDAVALFKQETKGAPFQMVRRAKFGKA